MITECPQCGGDIWNNVAINKRRIANGEKPRPDYSCKDKEGCGWVKWPVKEKKEFPKFNSRNEGQIIRQHSQEMALMYCQIKGKKDFELKELGILINWFEADAKGVRPTKEEPLPPEPQEPEQEEIDIADIPF